MTKGPYFECQLIGTLGIRYLSQKEPIGEYSNGEHYIAVLHFRHYSGKDNIELPTMDNFIKEVRYSLIEHHKLSEKEADWKVDSIFDKKTYSGFSRLRHCGEESNSEKYGEIFRNSEYMRFKSIYEIKCYEASGKRIPQEEADDRIPIGSIVKATITMNVSWERQRVKNIFFNIRSLQQIGFRKERHVETHQGEREDSYEPVSWVGDNTPKAETKKEIYKGDAGPVPPPSERRYQEPTVERSYDIGQYR